MASLVYLSFLIIQFMVTINAKRESALFRNAAGDFSVGDFKQNPYHYLWVKKLALSMAADKIDCTFSCVGEPKCRSFNMAATPDSKGLYLCELLSSNKYEAKKKFHANATFHHYSPKSPCESDPCKNGAGCVPEFEMNTYHCDCKQGFRGTHCEQLRNGATGNWTVKTAKTNNLAKKALCYVNNNFYSGPNCEKIEQRLDEMTKQISELKENQANCSGENVYKNCADVYQSGYKISGVYIINPDGLGDFQVFCDQKTAGGGWTVFQKRQDGSVDFYRGWDDYKRGFGNLSGEFWLGLEKIHRLTASSSDKLRVDLEDTNSQTSFAEYSSFAVASESSKFRLSLGNFSGTIRDSLSYHRGFPFTTKDRDNDNISANCAHAWKGAWWYKDCYDSNLNGLFSPPKSNKGHGMVWHRKSSSLSENFKRSEMKIRPNDF